MTDKPKELVVISGKGGTGKTSVTASFALLAQRAVMADCDVDAADLHLVLAPDVRDEHEFYGGRTARIEQSGCTSCGICQDVCRFDAVTVHSGPDGRDIYEIDEVSCDGCGVCVWFCPTETIQFPENLSGHWYRSQSRVGPMVHAKLAIGAENSGKLVSVVRNEAKKVATEQAIDLIIVDGPPGIGCPVISAITGVDRVLVVSEPTVSGLHDLERVLETAGHFNVPASVCINKWDINPEQAEAIEARAHEMGAQVLGRIPYDPAVTRAQVEGKAVVELGGPAADRIREVWQALAQSLGLERD